MTKTTQRLFLSPCWRNKTPVFIRAAVNHEVACVGEQGTQSQAPALSPGSLGILGFVVSSQQHAAGNSPALRPWAIETKRSKKVFRVLTWPHGDWATRPGSAVLCCAVRCGCGVMPCGCGAVRLRCCALRRVVLRCCALRRGAVRVRCRVLQCCAGGAVRCGAVLCPVVHADYCRSPMAVLATIRHSAIFGLSFFLF